MSAPSLKTVKKMCVNFAFSPPTLLSQRQSINSPMALVRQVLGEERTTILQSASCFTDNVLNMDFSGTLFFPITSMAYPCATRRFHMECFLITRSTPLLMEYMPRPGLRRLWRQCMINIFPEWRKDNLYLRYCVSLPVSAILNAHSEAKSLLFFRNSQTQRNYPG